MPSLERLFWKGRQPETTVTTQSSKRHSRGRSVHPTDIERVRALLLGGEVSAVKPGKESPAKLEMLMCLQYNREL
ncbi:hypothetical protein L914_11396 [Phytophthora nicotianae]|uniref:Uncharacterized protein n=1 Tax=Phytophthora nicotianae TaxID=4792 RepID=W2N3C7_PHYNI|nr:hypothetical protein L914_11396 [Phytophthora nicotianae]